MGGFEQEGIVAAVGIHVGFGTPERTRALEDDFNGVTACLRVAGMAGVMAKIHVACHVSADDASVGVELEGKGFPLCVDRLPTHVCELPDLVFVEDRDFECRFVGRPRTGASGKGTQGKEGQECVGEVFHRVC